MSALTPNRFSRKRTSILTTLYSEVPFNKIEFSEHDSFDILELSQHILHFVLAEVSLNAMLVGMVVSQNTNIP